uniref:Metalloendopeptidase n=1 Tax=Magallana gigas TaxID=29159 RepID=A0A8W8MGF7_MAGGI
MWRYVAMCWAMHVAVTVGYPVSESQNSNQQKSLKQQILEDIRRELREYYNATSKREESGSGGTRNEDEIDNKDINPDDKNIQLLLSMGVEIDGVVNEPNGLHPEDSEQFKEQSLDRTIETDREADKEGKTRNKRNFGPSWVKWPKGIVPYEFDDSLVANRKPFLGAVKLFDDLTCIKWKPRSSEVKAEVGHDGYVRVKSGSGCSSGVGFGGDGEHAMSLSEPGCGSVGIAMHEMLHRLGQRHEQARNDRNRYVKIVWKNIQSGKESNFYRTFTYDRNPYDVGSVMQYGFTSFGGGKTTIEVIDNNLKYLTYPSGQILSFYDLKDVLDQYDCTAHCTNAPKCQNAGYVNTKCECECPEGFTGALCETVVTDQDCGGYLTLKEGTADLGVNRDISVSSPNYPGPVGQGKICRWAVKAPDGYIIKMTIDDLHMAYNPDTLRCYHWLEVQYNLPGQPGIRRCGDIVGESFLTSADSPTFMIVTMDTKFAGSRVMNKGFKLHFELEREVCRDNQCAFGVCVADELKACKYRCVCQPGYEGEMCDKVVDNAKLNCNFERFEKCFFDNVKEGADFEWGPGFKHSLSLGTGPEEAHRGLRFLFTEMSSPRKPGDKAIIRTTVPLPEKAGCLSFAYNMFGRNVNKLSLFLEDFGSTKTELWSKTGNQGSDWLTADINVPATKGLKLSFEAITGDSWDSDIALDDIWWKVGKCDIRAPKDCIEYGKEYKGTRSYTKKGVKCQAWNVNEPHEVTSKYAHFESNYCRMGGEADAWCYTTDTNTAWDWCGVPYCYATECSYASDGSDYVGTVSHTVTGLPCQMWDSNTPHTHDYNKLTNDQNYCRNTDSSKAPWCMTMDPSVRWGYCDVPRCERVEQECILTATGIDYAGKTKVTASGKDCLPWKDVSEHMAQDENYCRNPDSSGRPWCYVTGDTKPVKEDCKIPACAESPCFGKPCKNHGKCTVKGTSFTCTCLQGFKGDKCETLEPIEEADCKRTTTGWEYSGKIGVTKSGRTCQAWGSQTPHEHSYGTDLPGNYCRDPSDTGYLWCYTTDPDKKWEECNVPDCATPPLECIPASDPQGKLYFGTHNFAKSGDQCQRWDSQTPHKHSVSALSDQKNYCRSADKEKWPWCYTTNPDKRWDYCNIPAC